MRLVDIEEKFLPFDCASGMAPALLATGKVKVYVAPTFNVEPGSHVGDHTTHFQCREGARVEDYQGPPFIFYACRTCGQGQITGPNAHKGKVFHRPPKGFAQEIPGDVAVAFIALKKAYDKRK